MTLVHVLRTALVAAMASGLLLALPAGINVIAQPAAPSCQGKSVLGKRADGRPAITSCSGEELRSVCADKRLHEHARRESILATVRHVCGGTAMPAATCQGNGIADWLADRHPERYARVLARTRKRASNAEGNLWRIERKGVPASLLFAVLHDREPPLMPPLPAPLLKALANARLLAFEIDPKSMMDMLPKESLGTEVPLLLCPFYSLRLGTEPYMMEDLLVSKASKSAAVLTLEPELLAGQIAKEKTAWPAGGPAAGRPAAPSDLPPHELDELATLYDVYRREIAISYPEFLFEMGFVSAEERDRGYARSLEGNRTRNEGMARNALPELERGNIVIAVGALHLPGEHGLIELIRRAGYRVTRVR